ncbi:MAG: prepilin peptidase [Verrucomicrobiae bacterium]|nr:prepilin peptidase [Verrucomicrobiae bacterium]
MMPISQASPPLWASAAADLAVLPPEFGAAVVFIFGAVIGSLLNVCVYRMPRGESIVAPRSHCPNCNALIPWYQNIPLFSYIALRGRAACCGTFFSIRYWVVELATAIGFLLIWLSFPWNVALCLMLFFALMLIATCTDLEHYIIPNEITWGSAAAGLVCSFLVPALQHETSRFKAFGLSLAGAIIAYLVLWGIVEMGKILFGRRKVRFEKPEEVTIDSKGISVPGETMVWEDIFSRETDRLCLEGENVSAGEKTWARAEIAVTHDSIQIGEETFPLAEFGSLKATTSELVIPREAMGFGDVKLLTGIGAFLGPGALFFVVMVSSMLGAIVGLILLALKRRDWGGKLPYGPYLAFAAMLWIFFGRDLVAWYRALFVGSPE